MYIRNREEAMAAVGEILELPGRREQLIASTVKIMLCTDEEPRAFLGDCQRLLIAEGLEALQRERRALIDSSENVPIVVLDPEGDALFESVARAIDALRLSEVARQVFPHFGGGRWRLGRALLAAEGAFREALTEAIRTREKPETFARAKQRLEALIAQATPGWQDRMGALRAACIDVLRGAEAVPADRLSQEADFLFEVVATSDDWATSLLGAMDRDPGEAVRQILQLFDAVRAVRSLEAEGPSSGGRRNGQAA